MVRGKRRPSVMKHNFASYPSTNMQRSSFDRSHSLKTTMDVDYLVPIFVDEVLPGDTFILSMTHLCRLATLVQPVLDNIRLEAQFFYVPNRLLWDNFEEFLTGGDGPDSWSQSADSKFFIPQTISPPVSTENGKGGYTSGSLADYMGLPTYVPGYRHTVLPFRAYNFIFNEYYRDQNLQEKLPVWTGDADPTVDSVTGEESQESGAVPYTYSLMKRNKRYDYFTSALPGLQRALPVSIGIAGGDNGRLPVHGLSLPAVNSGYESLAGFAKLASPFSPSTSEEVMYGPDGVLGSDMYRLGSGISSVYVSGEKKKEVSKTSHSFSGDFGKGLSSTTVQGKYAPITGNDWPIYVDLSSAASVTINALRTAITLQQWFEKSARYGSRYTELLQGFFSVHTGDARVQRPEYLGGMRSYISVNPVVQSSSTDSTSPQGNLAAYALSTGSDRLFVKSFVEHGWILGLASVTADLTYQQGLDRMWSRFGRFDFYWPTFAHLGEQPVLNKELYVQSDSVMQNGVSLNDIPFGYQERYSEYRHKLSRVTGLFRSNAEGTLDSWHLSQWFDKLPTLNMTFMENNMPIDRALAVPDQPHLLCDFYYSLRCVRPMPIYSVPGLRRI